MAHGKFLLTLCVMTTLLCGCASLLYYPTHRQQTDLKKMGPPSPENIQFQSRDGIPLHGWYFRNKENRKPKGLIVFFHGNAENISTHFAALYWILDYGYDYFIFDYQGFGKSGGKPSPKNTVEDGRAALHWAHQRDSKVPLIVFGQSLGGAVALRAVIESKKTIPIQAVVVDSTFHSYKAVGRTVLANHWLTWLLQPLSYLLLSDRYAPGNRIAEISPIPLLILHGDQDQTVAYKLGEKVFKLAKEPKEFITVSGGHHTDAFWRHKGRYRKILLNRLKEYTKGKQE